jgi:hypothetical protein
MQTCAKILKFTFYECKIIFHITGALHVSTDIVIMRYFENCCTCVTKYNSKVYPRLCTIQFQNVPSFIHDGILRNCIQWRKFSNFQQLFSKYLMMTIFFLPGFRSKISVWVSFLLYILYFRALVLECECKLCSSLLYNFQGTGVLKITDFWGAISIPSSGLYVTSE